MKESLAKLSPNLIFRETFSSEEATRANGGTPTAVTYNNGVATFNGASSYVKYNIPLKGTYSVRIRVNGFTSVVGAYFVDFRSSDSFGVGYIYEFPANTLTSSSGTLYINGTASSSLGSTLKEIVVTGITISSINQFICMRYSATGARNAQVELFEIYQGTLTATEVSDLYSNKLYKRDVKALLRSSTLWGMYEYDDPATVVYSSGTSVARWMDKSHGMSLGSELFANSDFSTSSNWSTDGGWTISGGVASFSGATGRIIYQGNLVVLNAVYVVKYSIVNYVSGSVGFRTGASTYTSRSANGNYEDIITCYDASLSGLAGFYAVANSNLSIDNVSLKRISGNHLVQTTPNAQPTWGVDGIKFDGSNDYLKTAAATLNQPVTIYAVLKQNTWITGRAIIDGKEVNKLLIQQTSGGQSPNIRLYSDGASPSIGALTLGVPKIITAVVNGGSSLIKVNESTVVYGSLGGNAPSGLIVAANGAESNFSDITVKAIYIFNTAHTTAQRQLMSDYLKRRFNIKF